MLWDMETNRCLKQLEKQTREISMDVSDKDLTSTKKLNVLTLKPHPNLVTNRSRMSSRKPASVSSPTATKSSVKAGN